MATSSSVDGEASSTDSNTQDSNIVFCINFSSKPNRFDEFKKSLVEHFGSTLLSFEEDLIVKFDNKYYSADITFKFTEFSENTPDEELLGIIKSAQALVLTINGQENCWKKVREIWEAKISKKCSSDVKLICEYEDSDNSPGGEENPNLLWAIKEHFEYIPMEEEVDRDDEDNDFKETTGAARILEALQAHVWSNLSMKAKSPKSTDSSDKCIFDHSTLDDGKDSKPVKSEDRIDSLLSEMDVAGVLNDDDPDCESFENLFSNLMELKRKADGLEGDERKSFAEKVATMFMNAIPDSDDD